MSAERRAYLDTSALAKWYLNEVNSEAFVSYLQSLDSAVISSLTRTEVRSLLSRNLIIPGENAADYEALLAPLLAEEQPVGPTIQAQKKLCWSWLL